MRQDRRALLRSAGSVLLASSSSRLLSARPIGPAALLVPLTGPHAALGRSMERAARLAQGGDANGLLVLDTATGAVSAARQALRKRAAILLGPVFSGDVRAVVAAAGGVPVIAFSNDAGLLESGAFLLGITAAQGVTAILRYARGRGVRRVAMVTGGGGWGDQAVAAARGAAGATGLDLVLLPAGSGMDAIVRATPDAVLTVADAVTMAALGDGVRAGGIQLLGAFQGFDATTASLAGLEGAWLSAPDPAPFADFARTFEAAAGTPPGVIAGLAFDAARIAATLRAQGAIDRAALLAAGGYKGVCGAVRFRDDGSAARDLAILTVQDGRVRVVDRGGAT